MFSIRFFSRLGGRGNRSRGAPPGDRRLPERKKILARDLRTVALSPIITCWCAYLAKHGDALERDLLLQFHGPVLHQNQRRGAVLPGDNSHKSLTISGNRVARRVLADQVQAEYEMGLTHF